MIKLLNRLLEEYFRLWAGERTECKQFVHLTELAVRRLRAGQLVEEIG